MSNNELPFNNTYRKDITELFLQVKSLLQDTDTDKYKELLDNCIKDTSELYRIAVLGPKQTGKSSIVDSLYSVEHIKPDDSEELFLEYRYGDDYAYFHLDGDVGRVFNNNMALVGVSVTDIKGMDYLSDEEKQELKEYLINTDVLINVLSQETIRNDAFWQVIEELPQKKGLFILTKNGQWMEKDRESCSNRLKSYMSDAGIEAPVFFINIGNDGKNEDLDIIKSYILNLIGENPLIHKKNENMQKFKGMLKNFRDSFELRIKQNEQDQAIVKRINEAMDTFILESDSQILKLKKDVSNVIDREIEAYENEVIRKLNPKKIKENFGNNTDAVRDYLLYTEEIYRKRMSDNINDSTCRAIKEYLQKLETVFQDSVGYFKERKNLIALEDEFYGSMSKGKELMVRELEYNLEDTRQYYGTLHDASEELFMQLWDARNKYDRNVKLADHSGKITGAVAAGATAIHLVGIAAAKGTVAAAVTVGASICMIPVACILGAVLISVLAKKFTAGISEKEMMRNSEEAIEKFKIEVGRIKGEMTLQIMDTIDGIFRKELENADKVFTEFRISSNTENQRLPDIIHGMEKISILLNQLDNNGEIDG